MQVELEIAFVEFDFGFGLWVVGWRITGLDVFGQAVPAEGVVQGLVQIEFTDRVAKLVRLGAVDAFTVGTDGDFFVAIALTVAEVGEHLHQRLLLHLVDRSRGQSQLAFAVFIEHAVFEQLLEQIGLLLIFGVFHHLLQRLHGLVAVLHDEFHELVESRIDFPGWEFFAVVFAVEVLHVENILAGADWHCGWSIFK